MTEMIEMKYVFSKTKDTKDILLYSGEYRGINFYIVSLNTHPVAYMKK